MISRKHFNNTIISYCWILSFLSFPCNNITKASISIPNKLGDVLSCVLSSDENSSSQNSLKMMMWDSSIPIGEPLCSHLVPITVWALGSNPCSQLRLYLRSLFPIPYLKTSIEVIDASAFLFQSKMMRNLVLYDVVTLFRKTSLCTKTVVVTLKALCKKSVNTTALDQQLTYFNWLVFIPQQCMLYCTIIYNDVSSLLFHSISIIYLYISTSLYKLLYSDHY